MILVQEEDPEISSDTREKHQRRMSYSHEDVFKEYVTYYEVEWPIGNVKLCCESSVTDRAKYLLLSESEADKRFTEFDFYWILHECLKKNKDCRLVLCGLAKATELLEIYCVNVFLFPWKKEIKTLKTFTGSFVYHVQAVLPDHVANNILESIGYQQDTDMEYKLSKEADPGRAIRVGFELFLARQECKYLLEMMGEKSLSQCIEVLQERSSARYSLETTSEHATDGSGGDDASQKADISEVVSLQDGSLLDSGATLKEGCHPASETAAATAEEDFEQKPRSLEAAPLSCNSTPIVCHQPCDFMTNDRSILELQANYPDLTFRRKPVFSKPQVPFADQGRHAGEVKPSEGSIKVLTTTNNMSSPQSVAGISELSCPTHGIGNMTPQLGEVITKKPADVSFQARDTKLPDPQHSVQHVQQTGLSNEEGDADDRIVVELTEKMGNLQVNELSADEDLKYPIEETSHSQRRCHVPDRISPIAPPRDRTCAITCSPSQMPICTIADCTSCTKQNTSGNTTSGQDTIKEPPQSFYIPPSTIETQHSMLEGISELCRDVPASCQQCHHANVGSGSRPDDELLQTYVLVESKKEEQVGGAF